MRYNKQVMAYLIGIDIGTTNTKALLYDPQQGRVVDQAARPTPTDHPIPDWSQHDPEQLWQTVAACLRQVAAGRPVAGLAVSSLAEAGVGLDEHGQPVYPIIAWYDDHRPTAAWWETSFCGRVARHHRAARQHLVWVNKAWDSPKPSRTAPR